MWRRCLTFGVQTFPPSDTATSSDCASFAESRGKRSTYCGVAIRAVAQSCDTCNRNKQPADSAVADVAHDAFVYLQVPVAFLFDGG